VIAFFLDSGLLAPYPMRHALLVLRIPSVVSGSLSKDALCFFKSAIRNPQLPNCLVRLGSELRTKTTNS